MNNNIESKQEVECIKKHQNQPVILVLLDDKLPSSDRLLCGKCMIDYTGPLFVMSYKDAKDQITHYKQSVYKQIQTSLQNQLEQIEIFYDHVKSYQISINLNIDNMLQSLDLWRKKLQEYESNLIKLDILKELEIIKKINEQLIITKVSEIENYLSQLQKQQFQKIHDKYIKLSNLILLFKQDVNNLNSDNNQKKIEKEIDICNKITLQFQKTFPYNQQCNYITQNKNGTKLLIAQSSDIQFWNISQTDDIKREQQNQLNAHSNSVLCMVYSKKIDWFASGSDDCTVKSWILDSKNQWKCNGKTIVHFGVITGLILNDIEDELISCSFDKSIRIWKVYQDENKLIVNQALHKHQDHIMNINYSESYKYFVSFSKDKTIIIWEKGIKEWLFKQLIKINQQDIPQQICFLSDYRIIASFPKQGNIQIYKKENNIFIDKSEQKIELLNQQIQSINYCNLITNHEKRLIIIIHNKKILFFYYDKDFSIKKMLEIENNGLSYGSLNNEGKQLIIWNKQNAMFHMFQILYEYQ